MHAKLQKAKAKVYCKHFDPEYEQLESQSEALVSIPTFPKSSADASFLKKVLKGNFVFADLSDAELDRLIEAFQQFNVKADDIIIQQGDTSSSEFYFYVLQSGTVKFLIDGEEVFRNDEAGAAFGELELLYDFPRAATCQAVQDSILWKVDQATFRRVVSRYAVEQDESATDLRHRSPLFAQADNETLTQLADRFTTVKFKKDDKIIGKGDLGEVFYIIQEGTVRVTDIGTGTSPLVDQTLSEGDWFGELELKTGEPRVANITAATDRVVTLAMSKDDYLELMCPILQPILDREARKRFLKALPIFSNCNSAFTDIELLLLVDKLKEKTFERQDVVVDGSKDDNQRSLWIIQQGNVSLFDGHATHHLQRGDYFGDKWINEASRRADHTSISAKTAKATCVEDTTFFVLDDDDIEEVIGDIARLGASMPYQYPGLDNNIQLDDIQKHRILGKGMFHKNLGNQALACGWLDVDRLAHSIII